MAFLNRVGNLLKQKVTKHVTSQFSASNSSLFQAIRSMSSSSKLFVGGLSYSTDEMSLREAFSQYGEVVEVRVILDRETGRSRGFGFITYTSSEAASSAIQAFDGQDLHGRRIRVNYATEKPRGGGFGGGFGAGGGFNYGGQGGNYGRGGYQGGNYPGGDGSFGGGDGGYGGGNQYPSGGGGYGSGNQYPSGGGGFGSGNQYPGGAGGSGGADNYPSGGGSGYGGGDSVQGDGNYGGGGSNYFSGSQTGFSSLLNDEKTGENQEPLGDGPQGGIDAGNDNFGQDISDEENRNNDEQNDHVNTRS